MSSSLIDCACVQVYMRVRRGVQVQITIAMYEITIGCYMREARCTGIHERGEVLCHRKTVL